MKIQYICFNYFSVFLVNISTFCRLQNFSVCFFVCLIINIFFLFLSLSVNLLLCPCFFINICKIATNTLTYIFTAFHPYPVGIVKNEGTFYYNILKIHIHNHEKLNAYPQP